VPDTRLHPQGPEAGNTGAVLFAGAVAGLWRLQTKGKQLRVTVDLFAPLDEEANSASAIEAARVALICGAQAVEVSSDEANATR
jgi:hypothetical protein